MAETFTTNITKALDEVAPFKKLIIKSTYKFGLSEATKELMKSRDLTRNRIKHSSVKEKQVLLIMSCKIISAYVA